MADTFCDIQGENCDRLEAVTKERDALKAEVEALKREATILMRPEGSRAASRDKTS